MRPEPPLHGSREPIVMTGFGLVASLGLDGESVWRAVCAGRCGSGPMTAMESTLPPGRDGGQARDLPADFAPALPRESRYLRFSVLQALQMAGADPARPYPAHRCATMLGTTLHGIRAGGRFLRSGNPDELRSFLAGSVACDAITGLGLGGAAVTTCSACSSSLGAIALGVTLLQTGAADLVVAGGYDTISEYAWGGFNSLRVVAAGPLRPFSKAREGMKLAEGYGIVVLERGSDAAARRATPIVTVAGWGESADAHHLTRPHPDGFGAARAMNDAIARASVSLPDIGLIAAHATGTSENDAAEFRAISSVLGDRLAEVPVVAFKSHLGHTLGGAGVVELILSALAIRDQLVPPCANVTAQEVEYPSLRLSTGRAEHRTIRSSLNTSLGFGGANTSVVLTPPSALSRRTIARTAVNRDGNIGVWITGLGVVLPGIASPDALARLAFSAPNPDLRTPGNNDRPREIDEAALEALIGARRARRMSPCVKLTLAASGLALADAGLISSPTSDRGSPDLAAMSAMVASMHGSPRYCSEYYRQIVSEGILAANPMLFAEGVPNAAAAHVSTAFGILGGCQTIIGTRTSGLDALRLGAARILSGECERVLVAAAEESEPTVDLAYRSCGLRASEEHTTLQRDGRGFRNGPGAVAVLIESSDAARVRGARRYAAVTGFAACSASREELPSAVARVACELGRPSHVLGSANGTWLDRAEAEGLRSAESGQVYATLADSVGELFSVTPLAGIAAVCNRREFPGQSPARCSPLRTLIALCTDWSGLVSAIRLEPVE